MTDQGAPETPADPPLLPTLRHDPAADRGLRESLRVLRATADPELRRRIDAVLEGRESLRTLARDGAFSDFVEPLAEKGWRQWDALSDEEKEQLTTEAQDQAARERR